MAENNKDTAKQVVKTQEKVKIENPTALLESNAKSLTKFGGFALIETAVDGAKAMNPTSKARKGMFLNDAKKQSARDKLKSQLNTWIGLLEDASSLEEVAKKADDKAKSAKALLNKNLEMAVAASNELEQSYRSVALFFKNTEQEKVRNVTFFNTDLEFLKDTDDATADIIVNELDNNHNRLDLRNNYSLLVIPGYLGERSVVEKFAKIAYKNKVMLLTDFMHLEKPDDVIQEFDEAKLTGSELEFSNVMMSCNWLKAREKREDLNEFEDMYVSPSSALAGKVYSTLISQPAAGKMHGGLNEISDVTFDLKKSEITELEKRGLIPMVNEFGKVMAFSAKTLNTGNDIGLQTYSVVRVFDYIGKVIIDFLNRQAFVNWSAKVERDMKLEIGRYLESVKGHDKIIEKFQITGLTQDKATKQIHLDLHITPFFPAKNFLLRMGGTKGDTADEWKAEYSETN